MSRFVGDDGSWNDAAMDPIRTTIDRWHDGLRTGFPDGFDGLLHEDCVFWSPVVYRPQEGREITALYLSAAFNVLPGDDNGDAGDSDSGEKKGSFRYTKRILEGHHAMLEFESRVDGIDVNGVDIITCDDDGMITEFKVMVRPQKAVEALRQQMAAMLEKLSAG